MCVCVRVCVWRAKVCIHLSRRMSFWSWSLDTNQSSKNSHASWTEGKMTMAIVSESHSTWLLKNQVLKIYWFLQIFPYNWVDTVLEPNCSGMANDSPPKRRRIPKWKGPKDQNVGSKSFPFRRPAVAEARNTGLEIGREVYIRYSLYGVNSSALPNVF